MKVYRASENIYCEGKISIYMGTMFIVENYLMLPFVQKHGRERTNTDLNSLKYYDEVDLATMKATRLTDIMLTC